jgi:uncharacterized protein YlaI
MYERVYLHKCFLCGGLFDLREVEEAKLEDNPGDRPVEVYVCKECKKTLTLSKYERLAMAANKIIGFNNEITIEEGDLKIHLVRITPPPVYSPPIINP